MTRIGVLATQGNVDENIAASRAALGPSGSAVRVTSAPDVDAVDALVIPGGESTAIGPLSEVSGAMAAVRRRAESDSMPILGICAGLVLMASTERAGAGPEPLGLLDVDVERNAYGRQRASFEADVAMPSLGIDSLRGAFIRAPSIARTGAGVEVLANLRGRAVAVRQDTLVGVTFHSELAGHALHAAFARVAAGAL